VLIPSVGEKRFLFVIPWQGRTVIGTTDTDYAGSLDDPIANTGEVDRVVQSASVAFPDARLSNEDVISTFAGLRPLIAGDGKSTKELSRKEEVFEDAGGLITITGGKLTTWRRMAERVTDFVVRRLDRIDSNPRRRAHRCETENILLAGGPGDGDARENAQRAASEFGVGVGTAAHLIDAYGGNYRVVLEITRETEALRTLLIDSLPHIEAEVVYAARYEMAATADDFLSRRTRIGLLARDHGRSCAARVAELLARHSGGVGADDREARSFLK
jgi:glycerol-3-phosphate dehydrogenase